MEEKLSEQLKTIIVAVEKLQANANEKGYSVDLESILIGLEGHVSSFEYYENQHE